MENQFTENIHVLNGDALKAQFPASIPGKLIVTRECLVDGNLDGDSLSEFFKARSDYLSSTYALPVGEYAEKSIPQFLRICELPSSSSVHLWFEDDLFCQVNLWFIAYLITHYTKIAQVSLVRPADNLQLGFGGLSQEELTHAWNERIRVSPASLQSWSKMWILNKEQELVKLMKVAKSISSEFPFLIPAVQAQLDRNPATGLGRPHKLVMELLSSFTDPSFSKIFTEFSKRAPIYGFGDLQVKRIWEECKYIRSTD